MHGNNNNRTCSSNYHAQAQQLPCMIPIKRIYQGWSCIKHNLMNNSESMGLKSLYMLASMIMHCFLSQTQSIGPFYMNTKQYLWANQNNLK